MQFMAASRWPSKPATGVCPKNVHIHRDPCRGAHSCSLHAVTPTRPCGTLSRDTSTDRCADSQDIADALPGFAPQTRPLCIGYLTAQRWTLAWIPGTDCMQVSAVAPLFQSGLTGLHGDAAGCELLSPSETDMSSLVHVPQLSGGTVCVVKYHKQHPSPDRISNAKATNVVLLTIRSAVCMFEISHSRCVTEAHYHGCNRAFILRLRMDCEQRGTCRPHPPMRGLCV